MIIDQNSEVVKLCAKGMASEVNGNAAEAYELFLSAWEQASNDQEKFIAAHYVARHQKSVVDKLKWDKIALDISLKMNDDNSRQAYSSLYLNVAKCYEDLGDFDSAKENYLLAQSFTTHLSDDGYGNMIRGGIMNGLKRTKKI